MKHIQKGEEPSAFTEWKHLENDDWKPSYDSLSGAEKEAVINALKVEQGYICCYCERSLEDNNCHIEHLKPQHLHGVDPLNYGNMVCSCQLRLKKAEPRHCGNSKGSWYAEKLFISPLSPDCENKFSYTFDGHIAAASDNDLGAITTIEKLQLKIDKLNALRNKAIEPFIDDELSDLDVRNFATGYLVNKEHNNGRFNEFYTTIKYLFSVTEIS